MRVYGIHCQHPLEQGLVEGTDLYGAVIGEVEVLPVRAGVCPRAELRNRLGHTEPSQLASGTASARRCGSGGRGGHLGRGCERGRRGGDTGDALGVVVVGLGAGVPRDTGRVSLPPDAPALAPGRLGGESAAGEGGCESEAKHLDWEGFVLVETWIGPR